MGDHTAWVFFDNGFRDDINRVAPPLLFSRQFNATLTDKRWLMRHANGKRTHHLHLAIPGQPLRRKMVGFRDALRADAGVAARYESLKRKLAAQPANDREAYTAEKTEFINRAVGA
jgi:GrpB-like predicted nucleotidyltransferase (UPF0157 family)